MKKLLFLLLFIPLLAFTQVPQGVGYQGVATDANGIELVNQSISIRASIISASPTGTIEWQETHNTSTDTFGLFTLTIGQGTSAGTGVQTSFADITWGANTHFLKIEMDVNGGTNYSHMGTNQMMSVPYALYAENANIDYDSIATILSNDSSFVNSFSFGGNMVFGDFESINYTANSQYSYSDTTQAQEDGFLIIKISGGAGINNGSFYVYTSSDSILSNNENFITAFGSGQVQKEILTLPIKKDYYFWTSSYTAMPQSIKWLPIINGSSSSTSTVDSSYIDSLVQFYSSGSGGGCDYSFPEGLNGDQIIHDLDSSSFTVPPGKNLYITNLRSYGSSSDLQVYIDGIIINSHQVGTDVGRLNIPIIVGAGQIVSTNHPYTGNSDYFGVSFNGLLVDKKINSIIHDLDSSSFTVPPGKNLYITNLRSYGSSSDLQVYIDGIIINSHQVGTDVGRLNIPIIVGAGQIVSTNHPYTGNSDYFGVSFNGYLVDENYFADCGGGGSSSTSIDSTYIDSLVQFYSSGNGGGGCNFSFPDGLNGVAINTNFSTSNKFIVPTGKRLYILSTPVQLKVNGVTVSAPQNGTFVISNSGDTIVPNNTSSYYLNGILVDAVSAVNAITTNFSTSNKFIVPPAKQLYVLSTPVSMKVNGINTTSPGNGTFVVCNSGDTLVPDNTSSYYFNGYLVDENYFADCGGGGSSSSSSSLDSLTIVSIINNLMSQNFGLSVGDYFQGGIVVYIFQPGDSSYVPGEVHGYVAYSDGSNLPWGCDGIITSINNISVGQGPTNTHILDSLCPESNFAAKWCSDLTVGIYDDWFLPNPGEMLLVGPTIIGDYFGYSTDFWTSTEFSSTYNGMTYFGNYNPIPPYINNAQSAYSIYTYTGPFSNSNPYANAPAKSSLRKVIAFREF